MTSRDKLRRRELDSKLGKIRASQIERPKVGWARTIRSLLGMTLAEFGGRLGYSAQGAQDLERAEQDGSITLERLRKAARALNCEVQVYLVPVTSLEETVRERAMEVARRRLARSNRSMALEAQEVDSAEVEAMVKDLADEILATGTKRLWTDED